MLLEYKFTNEDEAISGLNNNKMGIKIDSSFKNQDLKRYLKKYFDKCNAYGIKDTTYGIQLLFSKSNFNYDDDEEENGYDTLFYSIITNDGFYEFLKSYKKPWVKEISEYKQIINDKWDWNTPNVFHKLEKKIQEESNKHGKKAKGSGDIADVKTLYNDGVWALYQPTSFQGEKAIAFYGKKGEKQTTCEWCTRADEHYYNSYSKYQPLFVFRNFETGKSYQLAFEENGHVDFLDQNDVRGDEITKGDLRKIPDNLLKLVKFKGNGRTLLDYKNNLDFSIKKGKKYLSEKDVYKTNNKNTPKFGKIIDLNDKVAKQEILNFSGAEAVNKFKNHLTDFFQAEKMTKIEMVDNYKKTRATKYFLKNNPEVWIIFTTIISQGKSQLNDYTFESDKYHELFTNDRKFLYQTALKDFGFKKQKERKENNKSHFKKVDEWNQVAHLISNDVINNLRNKKFTVNGNTVKLIDFNAPEYFAGYSGVREYFLPSNITVQNINTPAKTTFNFLNNADKGVGYLNASKIKINSSGDKFDKGTKLFKEVSTICTEISKQIMKEKAWRNLHNLSRQSNPNRPIYEEVNYFPY